LLIGTAISLFFVPWIALKAWILPLPDTVQEQVDQAIGHGFDGIIVYVEESGKPPVTYTAGWHDRKNKIPAKPQALFKIASVNKLYVAVAVTKLVNDKRLSLDKTLADYLPELVGKIENAEKITLRLLVQHRSGIPNYTNTPDYWATPLGSYEEKLELILNLPARFQPGQDYQYCNTNYLLLNKIMDNTLGYKNFRFIQDEILIPMDLNNTFGSLSEVNIDDVMGGYHIGHEPDLKTDNRGTLATAADVGAFLRALNDGSLLSESEKEIYTSLYEYEHTGWIPGYQSIAKYYEDIDAVVIQFNNTTDRKLYMWNLAEIIHKRTVRILRRRTSS